MSFRAGGTINDHAFAVALDAGRSLIVGGRIEMSGLNYQLVKYDSAGVLTWRRTLGGPTGSAGVTALATDNARNVYVTGVFSGTAPFLGVNLTSAGSGDIFVLKLDPSGNRVWVKRFGGAGSERADAIAVRGSTGEAFLAGSFTATTNFGGGALTNAGGDDALVMRLDALGNHVYSRAFGGAGADQARSVGVDSNGNAFVVGSYQFNVDFGAGPSAFGGNVDAFVVKLGITGITTWAKGMGGTSVDQALAVSVDGSGRPAVAGAFKRTVDFGGGPVSVVGGDDAFVAAYTATGAHRFSYALGGQSHARAVAVVSDTSGGIAVIGDFQGTDASFGALGTRSSNGARDVFSARFNAAGAPLSVSTFGAAGEDLPRAAALRDGLLTIVGDFKNSVSFGGSALGSAGAFDAFVARYAF